MRRYKNKAEGNRTDFTSDRFQLFAFLVVISATMLAVFFILPNPRTISQQTSNHPKAIPSTLEDTCFENTPTKFSCYKKELTDLTKQSGPERAFALLKQQYSVSSYVKSQCHQLVHVIGRAAYAKYGNIAETFAHGDQYCWAGYYHGLMEQVADEDGTNKFLASITQICATIEKQKPYSFDHFNCVHGLGHGVMEALGGNLFQALTTCDTLTNNFDSTSCYGGVFMQNIMTLQSPDETVDHTSAYLKPDEPMYPCTAVDTKYKGACYLMQTSYALQTQSYNFGKVFALCAQVETNFRPTCYQSLGRDASGNTISDVQGTKNKCLLGPDYEARSNCIVGAVKDFVAYFHSQAKGNQLCAALPQNLKSICYTTAKNFYSTF